MPGKQRRLRQTTCSHALFASRTRRVRPRWTRQRQILPAEKTLRVRLIAPLADRIQVISQRFGVPAVEAESKTKQIDHDRVHFAETFFHKHALDPHSYDLVLNVSRFTVEGSANVIIGAFEEWKSNHSGTNVCSTGKRN